MEDDVTHTTPQRYNPPPSDQTLPENPDHPALASTAFDTTPPLIAGFTLIETIAAGGMGIVYRARQNDLGRIVALKMMHAGPTASPTELQRFRSEILSVASIEHPHVVRVFSSGDTDGRPYLAMEFLSGGSLNQLLKKRNRLPPRTTAEMLRKLALAIQAAHDLGIVHRDLKPANILFDGQGEPKVTDFGLAKTADSGLTATNAIMGTAAYMAPEQARGESKFVGPKADVWALGVILYECLAGVRPFPGAHNIETLQNVIQTEPAPLHTLLPGLPVELQLIVQKCLQKNPALRFASAADVADDLDRWLKGLPMSLALTDTWELRFQNTGVVVPVTSAARILDGLRSGEWDTTDEVRGPTDNDWRPIEDHPIFTDVTPDFAAPRFDPPDETRLDMNPLIDVSLVLLIFFILTTTYSSLRRSIDVPAEPDDKSGKVAKLRPDDVKDKAFTVTVWMDGDIPRIRVEDRIIDAGEVERCILDTVRATGRRELILSVEGKVPWGVEATVHDAAKAAEIRQIYRRKYKPVP